MSSKLLNSVSSFFDGSPLLKKLKDTFRERDSILEPGLMTASNVLVNNNEVIQLVVSCDGISTTLDIIIPEIAVKELISNTIEEVESKNEYVDKSTSCHSIAIEEIKSNSECFDKSTSCHLITEQNCQQSQDVLKVSCPDTCNCEDCPFLKDEVPMLKVIMKESEAALNPKESVLSIPHISMSSKPLDANKRSSFLKITSCMPIRDSKLVLHWKVESYNGILGYRVKDFSLIQCFYLN